MKEPSALFTSDNASGVHPRVMEALQRVNSGNAVAYGQDAETRLVRSKLRGLFGQGTRTFFVFGGTAANVLAISPFMQQHSAVICADTAHLNVDECGAPERFLGAKLITLPSSDGKITAGQIESCLGGRGIEHHVQPGVVSITQPTECGTLYSMEEVQAISDVVHANGMFLHIDGARFANAAAALGRTDPSGLFREYGADVLSFGGTKNGMMYGEAIIFREAHAARAMSFIRKQGMQLASKMRYISAQFNALLQDDTWYLNAINANIQAYSLADSISRMPNIILSHAVDVNMVFCTLERCCAEKLREHYELLQRDLPEKNKVELRIVTSFDTSYESVKDLSILMKDIVSRHPVHHNN